MLAILSVINRISLRLANHVAVFSVAKFDPLMEFDDFIRRNLDQFLALKFPWFVTLTAEILHYQAGLAWVRHHLRAAVLEVLNPTDPILRAMDTEPVIRKQVITAYNQRYDQKITILEPKSCLQNVVRR